MQVKSLLSATLVSALVLTACNSTKQAGTTPAITYSGKVKTIIDENCANTCHNAARPAAGIDLTTYEKVKDQALNGKLIPAIQHAEGADPMPKKAAQLDDATIKVIVDWAATGALQ